MINIRDLFIYLFTIYIGLNFAQIKPFRVYCGYNIIRHIDLLPKTVVKS